MFFPFWCQNSCERKRKIVTKYINRQILFWSPLHRLQNKIIHCLEANIIISLAKSKMVRGAHIAVGVCRFGSSLGFFRVVRENADVSICACHQPDTLFVKCVTRGSEFPIQNDFCEISIRCVCVRECVRARMCVRVCVCG